MLEKILGLLTERGLTQKQLEHEAGLSENRISKWKAGQGSPSAVSIGRMAKILGVPAEYLLDDSLDAVPPPILTRDEEELVRAFRLSQLTLAEALDALWRRVRTGAATTADGFRPVNQVSQSPPAVSQRKAVGENERTDRPRVPKRIK